MKVNNNQLEDLKRLVGEATMLSPATSADFERLHAQMLERCHEAVGVSTLKRLWGYIEGYATVRESTLDVLCRYVGYPDWHTFVADYCQVESVQTSHRVLSATIVADQLQVGAILKIGWNPGRRLLLRHDGGGHFSVLEAHNSKVKVGDTFHCDHFILHHPLYVDNLHHADEGPTPFVLGKQGGLTFCRIVSE